MSDHAAASVVRSALTAVRSAHVDHARCPERRVAAAATAAGGAMRRIAARPGREARRQVPETRDARARRETRCRPALPANATDGAAPAARAAARRRRQRRRDTASVSAPRTKPASPSSPRTHAAGTWDAIRGDFGPDVVFLNRALDRVFETVAVDPQRHRRSADSPTAPRYAHLARPASTATSSGASSRSRPASTWRCTLHGKPRIFVSHGPAMRSCPSTAAAASSCRACRRRVRRDVSRVRWRSRDAAGRRPRRYGVVAQAIAVSHPHGGSCNGRETDP